MLNWIFDVPLWLSGPIIVVGLVASSYFGLKLVRTRFLPRLRITHADAHFAGTMVHSVMVFYGLVLALIAVNVFETYADASRIVTTEATAIAMLYRDAGAYPEPARSMLRASISDYVEQIIHEAWPQQRRGQVPTGGVVKMDRVLTLLAAFEPMTDGQRIIHAEAWRAFNLVIDARRTRLDALHTGLPGVMWLVVLLGAPIGLAAACFFHVEDFRLHATLLGLLATFIALVIFMVLAMDKPFRGDLGLTSEPYQLIYEQLMKPN